MLYKYMGRLQGDKIKKWEQKRQNKKNPLTKKPATSASVHLIKQGFVKVLRVSQIAAVGRNKRTYGPWPKFASVPLLYIIYFVSKISLEFKSKSQTSPWHSRCFPDTRTLKELLMFLFIPIKCKLFMNSTEELHHLACVDSKNFLK